MITEKDISVTLHRTIQSPIRIGSLDDLGIDKASFLDYFQPLFENLEDDGYLVRENQINLIKRLFSDEVHKIDEIHQQYFCGKLPLQALAPWTDRLTKEEQELFKLKSTVTRQRSIATFTIEKKHEVIVVERVLADSFIQNVEDIRSWKRVFKQANAEMVENSWFYILLEKTFDIVTSIHPNIQKIKYTAHFMRTITQGTIQGENSPEGVHEDGAQYIISALVVNRKNITGGETQIFEKNGETKDMLFHKELVLGEFAFQADTGEEKTFGNDLWHYVTPIQPVNQAEKGIRDIIGLDIEILR